MSKHTEGPWTAQLHFPLTTGGRTYAMITKRNSVVPIAAVVLGVEGCSDEQGRANARVIAALPGLVKALQQIEATTSTRAASIARDALQVLLQPSNKDFCEPESLHHGC